VGTDAADLEGDSPDVVGAFDYPGVAASITAAATSIVEVHGGALGFAVTVVAMDHGYSAQQIVEGPAIDADGVIMGVDPDGAPLGVLAAGPQGFGFRSAGSSGSSARDRQLGFLGATLDDVYLAGVRAVANQQAAEAAAAAEEAEARAEQDRILDTEKLMTIVVIALIAQGYSLEQALEGVFLSEFSVGQPCPRLPEPPAGPTIPALLGDCEPIQPASDEEDESTESAEAAAPDSAPTTISDDDGDLEAWCRTYDQFILSVVSFFNEFIDAGLSAEGDSDGVRDRFLPEFAALLGSLIPNSPGGVLPAVVALETAGMDGIGSGVGMGVEREGYYLEIDDFAEANCGFSLQSFEE
jgi:hypothetical protein